MWTFRLLLFAFILLGRKRFFYKMPNASFNLFVWVGLVFVLRLKNAKTSKTKNGTNCLPCKKKKNESKGDNVTDLHSRSLLLKVILSLTFVHRLVEFHEESPANFYRPI